MRAPLSSIPDRTSKGMSEGKGGQSTTGANNHIFTFTYTHAHTNTHTHTH